MRARLLGALVLYLVLPIKHHRPTTTADPQSLAAILAVSRLTQPGIEQLSDQIVRFNDNDVAFLRHRFP
jgi:hypothetical protein